MQKLSDYVFFFLKEHQITECFMLPGGGAMHLVNSLGLSGIHYTVFQHEQGAACAADGYAQHTNTPGFVLVTSGPGATNAITPVSAAFIDSTPMFIISGQAKRPDLVGDTGVRQRGSQELPVIPMVTPITKYAVEILEPNEIRYHLERAWHEAITGRPGPVWLSIPLDVQGAMIDETALKGFTPEEAPPVDYRGAATHCVTLLKNSKRPLMLAGNGISLCGGAEALYELLRFLPIPVETTWMSLDMFGEDHPLYMGHPGIMGDRGANLVLQEADLFLCVGSRLDTSLTAFDERNFAKSAKKVIVDIDPHEIARMDMDIDLALAGDAGEFIIALIEEVKNESFPLAQWKEWLDYGKQLRQKYPVVIDEYRKKENKVSPYYFMDLLSDALNENDVIDPESSGGAGEISVQAFRIKQGQKLRNASGLGSMGFGLPHSIGTCIANDGRRTVLINGDGAFQLNIQELETLHRLNLPIKIFIWCNTGYASIQNMQKNNFGRMVGSSAESGFTVPDVCKVAEAYGLKSFRVHNNRELEATMETVLNTPGPVLCAVETDPNETVSPRVKAFPQPDGSMKSGALENMWPEVKE